jgi:hypothetical protein
LSLGAVNDTIRVGAVVYPREVEIEVGAPGFEYTMNEFVATLALPHPVLFRALTVHV